MDSYLLFKAEAQNWSCISSGDWKSTAWFIDSDGLFEICDEFIPGWDILEKYPDVNSLLIRKHGNLNNEEMGKLKNLISRPVWRNQEVHSDACDGVAWAMEAYFETGEIIKTSGELDYIYGHETLENIADLLSSRILTDYQSVLNVIEKARKLSDVATVIDDEEGRILCVGL